MLLTNKIQLWPLLLIFTSSALLSTEGDSGTLSCKETRKTAFSAKRFKVSKVWEYFTENEAAKKLRRKLCEAHLAFYGSATQETLFSARRIMAQASLANDNSLW